MAVARFRTVEIFVLSVTLSETGYGVPEFASPGVKRPERESDHSPPSSAEAKNGGAISPPPPQIYLHGAVLN
jgi:hypothetical protein